MYSAIAIANAFIQRALDGKIKNLSQMKLQKLMFYTQSWHLRLKDKVLFNDLFAKWKYGPVIPSIYNELKFYGSDEIDHLIVVADKRKGKSLETYSPTIDWNDKETVEFLDEIIKVYDKYTAEQLSALTHLEGCAWSKTKNFNDPISHDDMKNYIYPNMEEYND